MSYRTPRTHPLANSDAPFALLINRHGEIKTMPVSRGLAIGSAISAGLLVSWLVIASVYMVFKDDFLAHIFSQQSEMQFSYEDRIATLRAQIDKVATRGLVNQDTVEAKIDNLLARQAKLETRQAMMTTLVDQVGLTPPKPPAVMQLPSPPLPGVMSYAPRKPSPQDGDARGGVSLPPDTSEFTGSLPPGILRPAQSGEKLSAAVGKLDVQLASLEQNQLRTLDAMEQSAQGEVTRWRSVITSTGLPTGRFERVAAKPSAASSAMGGPFVPLPTGRFEQDVNRLQSVLLEREKLRKVVDGLPLSRPMQNNTEITSPFGPRIDPFFHNRPAMHTGTDFRAPSGTAARVTAAGRVVEAGYNGGYGNMVEVDHGYGITTRYAHLSAILVEVGQMVGKGDTVGRVGSTGRSTGSHLHYEVRIDGEAIDPMRFIRSGTQVASK